MKKMNANIGLVIILYLGCVLNLNGQATYKNDFYKDPIPNTPEVNTFNKYIEYPVTLNYGLINVEIPLYELLVGGEIIPIKLVYHPSGNKWGQNHMQLRMGAGWALSTDYAISRQINGVPDNRSDSKGKGFLKNKEKIPPYDKEYIKAAFYGTTAIDIEPDVFSYKLLNNSGKFYYHRNPFEAWKAPELIIFPKEPIKVTTDSNYDMNYFEVTDDKGIHYRFGQNSGETGLVPGSFSDGNITKWNIRQITFPDKNEKIVFKYKKGQQVALTSNAFYKCIMVEDLLTSSEKNRGPVGQPLRWPFLGEGSTSNNRKYYNVGVVKGSGTNPPETVVKSPVSNYAPNGLYPDLGGKVDILDHYLSEIQTNDIKIEFVGDLKLEKIVVKDIRGSQEKIIRTITINQDYFTKGSTRTSLKLESVSIADKAGKPVGKYTFDYYNPNDVSPAQGDQYPVDYWGYFDNSKSTLDVPQQNVTVNHPESANGSIEVNIGSGSGGGPNLDGTKSGVLKTITYPTGRKSEFIYELNKYLESSTNKITDAGGLRIKGIKEYDSKNSKLLLEKEYKYGKDEKGAGKILLPRSKKDFMTEKTVIHGVTVSGAVTKDFSQMVTSRLRTFSSSPLIDPFYEGGATVHYDYVTEYVLDPNNQQSKIKTLYRFEDANPRGLSYPGLGVSFAGTGSWSGSKLIEKQMFETNGTVMAPKVKETLSYTTSNANEYKFKRFYLKYQPRYIDVDEADLANFMSSYYEKLGDFIIYSGSKLLTVQKSSLIESNGEVINTKELKYGNPAHMYVTEEIETGKVVRITTYKYPQDLSFTNTDYEKGRQGLINANKMRSTIQKTVSVNGKSKTTTIPYKIVNSKAVPAAILDNTGVSGADEERVTYKQYDTYGNPVEIVQDGTYNIIYLWSYQGRYPVAKITNSTYEIVKSKLGETLINRLTAATSPAASDMNSINGLRTTMHVTTYVYDPVVGLTSMTDPRGITTYYSYDDFGRLEDYSIDGTTIESYEYNYRNK